MIVQIIFFGIMGLALSSCASFYGERGPVRETYAPAAYGPLMDMNSLRHEKLQRAM